MHNNDKALAGATNTDQGTENLAEGLSTDHDTRTAPKPRKPKHRTWHISVGETSDGRAKGLCGWVSRPAPLIASCNNLPTEPNLITVKCPDCAEIVRMQDAEVRRRRRAEAITEMVMRHLENGEV